MSKLILQPKTSTFIPRHPVTGETNFGTEENPIEGSFIVAGVNSREFYDTINALSQEEEIGTNSEFGRRTLAGCIVGWETSEFYTDDNDNPIEYSQDAAIELVTNNDNLWIINQLRRYVEDSANFF